MCLSFNLGSRLNLYVDTVHYWNINSPYKSHAACLWSSLLWIQWLLILWIVWMIVRHLHGVLGLSLYSPLGAGYHDGFTIPAGATNILITEEPVNYNVFLGELPRAGQYVSMKEVLSKWRPSACATPCLFNNTLGLTTVVSLLPTCCSCDRWSSSTTEWWLQCCLKCYIPGWRSRVDLQQWNRWEAWVYRTSQYRCGHPGELLRCHVHKL